MTKKYPYTVDVVAFSGLTLHAAALAFVSHTDPEGDLKATLTGIVFLVISPFLVSQGLRRKPLIKIGFPPKPWHMSALFCFWLVFALVASHTLASVQTLLRLIYLVLAVYCLVVASALKWPSPRPAQND